jgi:hypothetical protein
MTTWNLDETVTELTGTPHEIDWFIVIPLQALMLVLTMRQ